jgi:hypothetical protein
MAKVWPEEVYQRVSVLDLILVSFLSLENSTKQVDFEILLKRCFDLFPEKFCFSQLELPDARKIDRPLRSLRRMKLVSGNPKESFVLTKKGRKKALEAMSFLRQRKLRLS